MTVYKEKYVVSGRRLQLLTCHHARIPEVDVRINFPLTLEQFLTPSQLRVRRVPDLHPLRLSYFIGVVFALSDDAFQVLLTGQGEELLSMRLDAIAARNLRFRTNAVTD